jgi:hypothetical protein
MIERGLDHLRLKSRQASSKSENLFHKVLREKLLEFSGPMGPSHL